MKRLVLPFLLISYSAFAQSLTGFSGSNVQKQLQAESFFLRQQGRPDLGVCLNFLTLV